MNLETHIRDDTRTNIANSDYERQYRDTITMFADAAYLLRLRLACPQSLDSNFYESDCTLAHHVDIFIDLNNDGIFDQSENRIYRRSLIDTETPENTFDLQISIPPINAINNNNAGTHRMQVRLTRSESYQNQCGKNEHSEIREYTVNIIPRRKCPGKIYLLIIKD